MKQTLLLLLSLLIMSCNTARKTKTNIEDLEVKTQTNNQSDSGTKSDSGSKGKVDLSRLIDEFGFYIKGNGQQYSLNYGGLQFIGSADIELKKKTDSYRIINIYQNWNVYHHWDVTKTKEITKTKYKNKLKNTEAKKDNFWLGVLIFIAGMATMLLLIFLWKKYNPLQNIKKWINQRKTE